MRAFSTFIIFVIGFLALSAFTPEGKKSVPKLQTYFACKQNGKIAVSAEQFLQNIKQPFCAKDSLDSLYEVVKFDMIYAETGLYQDSSGLPIVHTDYSYGTFQGDKVDDAWAKVFQDHIYKGDTIRFKNILVKGADKRTYRSSNIELVIR